jgi:hypothetical protein
MLARSTIPSLMRIGTLHMAVLAWAVPGRTGSARAARIATFNNDRCNLGAARRLRLIIPPSVTAGTPACGNFLVPGRNRNRGARLLRGEFAAGWVGDRRRSAVYGRRLVRGCGRGRSSRCTHPLLPPLPFLARAALALPPWSPPALPASSLAPQPALNALPCPSRRGLPCGRVTPDLGSALRRRTGSSTSPANLSRLLERGRRRRLRAATAPVRPREYQRRQADQRPQAPDVAPPDPLDKRARLAIRLHAGVRARPARSRPLRGRWAIAAALLSSAAAKWHAFTT